MSATLALVQVAKILQCGANHTHWNPEKPFAALIDRFLDTELNPLVDSLSQEILVRTCLTFACTCDCHVSHTRTALTAPPAR